ncbi:uncharacterized protein LOC126852296 [Cataglyphis hispanica]|uniref:uncharacterized protein LOC126852296 n=1 Tax=Cataglyphis hispanica TaxID=1086592 RepID=UPI00217F83D5|nr:uncharacterized protein LOC126852296 [Cataglyphis hispanica]
MLFTRIKKIVRRIFYSSHFYIAIFVFITCISVSVIYKAPSNDEDTKLNTTNNLIYNKSIYNLDDVKQILLPRYSKHSEWDHIAIKAVISTFAIIFLVTFLILCRCFIKKYTPTIINLFIRLFNRNESARNNNPASLYQDIYLNADTLEHSSQDEV